MRNGRITELEVFSGRPSQSGGADGPGRGCRLAVGQVAVAEGKLAGSQVAADQQVMPPGGGGQSRPGCGQRHSQDDDLGHLTRIERVYE
jgi:hypothetical protein